jgi:hypothetical protein
MPVTPKFLNVATRLEKMDPAAADAVVADKPKLKAWLEASRLGPQATRQQALLSKPKNDGSPSAPKAPPTHRVSLTADELEKLLGTMQGSTEPKDRKFVEEMTPVLSKLRMEEMQTMR